jgi:glycerol-3-phosphate dehydrogenase
MEVEAMPIKAEDEEPLKVVDAEDAVVVKAVGPWVDRTTPRRKSLICWSP